MAPWSNRARERDPPVECELEAVPEDDAHVLGAAPRVDGADGQRARRSTRAADAAVPGAGVPVVPGGSDDERVEAQGTGRSARGRAVDEGGEGLADADERDPRGVMRAAVPVRVDRALEPGDQLVGAAEEAPACRARSVATLRPGSAGGRHAAQPLRAPQGPSEPATMPANWVPWRSRREASSGFASGSGIAVAVDHVTTLDDLAEEEGVVALDSRIEERNGDAVPVVARQRQSAGGPLRRRPGVSARSSATTAPRGT